ncbi:unnamed protein product [Lasius platythorax]|uniref:Uncharacterized protein n=1 Tax=Lasius platythorax TaxID=488582 RepID=A0AAV2N925_9HYME
MGHWSEGQTHVAEANEVVDITIIMCMGVNILGAISVTLLTVRLTVLRRAERSLKLVSFLAALFKIHNPVQA